jgi:serine phosphatase RsbU (regulator of sigma subunit)
VLVRASVSLGRARLSLANAGHPPPLVLRADGTVSTPRALGSILGVSTSRLTHEIGLDLEPGDALVLFTDGVTEARFDDGLFGESRLIDLLRPVAGEPAETIVHAIRRALVPPVELRDDVALMVISAPTEQ